MVAGVMVEVGGARVRDGPQPDTAVQCGHHPEPDHVCQAVSIVSIAANTAKAGTEDSVDRGYQGR